jgi:hypothetical protein
MMYAFQSKLPTAELVDLRRDVEMHKQQSRNLRASSAAFLALRQLEAEDVRTLKARNLRLKLRVKRLKKVRRVVLETEAANKCCERCRRVTRIWKADVRRALIAQKLSAEVRRRRL